MVIQEAKTNCEFENQDFAARRARWLSARSLEAKLNYDHAPKLDWHDTDYSKHDLQYL